MVSKKTARGVPVATPAQAGRQAQSDIIAARIRSLRRKKGMTLEQLATATALDRGFLSRVERGQKTPSIATLLRVASALDLQMAHLFGEFVEPNAITVVRRADHKGFPGRRDTSGHGLATILPPTSTRRLSAYMISPEPTAAAGTAEHAGDELVLVLEGQVEVEFADRRVTLNEGDCVHFDGHLQHGLRRSGSRPARALIVIAQDLAGSKRS